MTAATDLRLANDWAAGHLSAIVDDARDEARNVQAYAIRAHLETALTPGTTERDVLNYCQHVFAIRFLCDWTDEEAATIALGALAGWHQRVQRNPERYTCTCTMLTSQTPWEPADWEQDPNCPIHPMPYG